MYRRYYKIGGKSSAPAAPDYTAAAQATAQGNLDATRSATAANRVNQVTPYGNLTYSQTPTKTFNSSAYQAALQAYNSSPGTYDPLTGQYTHSGQAPNQADYYMTNPDTGWTATTTLSPAEQQILNQTNALNSGLLGTAQSGLDYANSVMSKPGVDQSQLAQVGINPGQSYQDAMMARLQPQIQRENQQSDAQLANQGITQGSEAYNNAKTLLNQQHNDLLNSATVQGFNTGLAANQQGFQQAAYNQMQPINLINALRTGSQVQNPNFTAIPQQATTQGADLLGATNATYGAQLGATNANNAAAANTTNGLLSSAALYAMLAS